MKSFILALCILGVGSHVFGQWITSGSHVYNSNAGNVGIGTLSPATLLHINNNTGSAVLRTEASTYSVLQIVPGSNNNYAYLDLGLNSTTKFGWQIGKDIDSGTLGGANGFYIYEMGAADGTRFVINKGGNVGIGTRNPKERLSVNGKIRAHKVQVETANWPDYVFKKSYLLRSLADLEKFVAKNHHLPEIPSAYEVETNGLHLGEMNASLLKKIEELTLYLIDQDKKFNNRIEELERQILVLKK